MKIDRQLARESALTHFSSCIRIEDKAKRLVIARANVFQRRITEVYDVLNAVGVPVRILGLKIRQCGGTTIASHLAYHRCQCVNTDAVIIANVKENAQEILSKIRRFASTDILGWNNPLDARANRLAWDNGSRIEITSAETMNTGISRTRQFVLLSEACKYPRGGVKDDRKIMASILPSVPDEPGTCVIAESTPDGASGWFYEQWQKALTLDEFIAAAQRGEARPGNGWVKVFASWFEFSENARTVTPKERARILSTLTVREQRGIKDYQWTVEQIAWRRDTMASECGGSEDVFDEYYPEDDVTCFLTSGRPRFNMQKLMLQEKNLHSHICEEGTLDIQQDGSVIFSPETSGYSPYLIWERPRIGCRYLLWCDPATGEDQTEGRDPDRHSIGVLRAPYAREDGLEVNAAVVARVRAPFDGTGQDVADRIIALSRFYGECLIVLEINMGLHILALLQDSGLPIYRREVVDPYDRNTRSFMLGWKLKDRGQRRMIIDSLALAIQDQTLDIWCPHIISECKTFIINKSGKETARPGTHDDDVMGLAMGHYCLGSATLYSQKPRKRRKPADWRHWKRA